MKKMLFVFLVFSLAACGINNKDQPGVIQGVYVGQYETEYSKGKDTIAITPLNSEAGTFHFVRRVSFMRISKGLLGKPEHVTEITTCVFNKEAAQLTDQKHGSSYFLSSDGKQLVRGNTFYRRIQ